MESESERTGARAPATSRRRDGLGLAAIGVAAAAGLAIAGPIPQDLEYHCFADDRALLGIPNALDVLSNAPFLVVGALGLRLASRAVTAGPRLPVTALFVGVFLTGLGSAWYHLAPSNASLVWDRLPMTLVFMSVLALAIHDHASERFAVRGAPVFLLVGVGSVAWWAATDDLRLYAFVQFFPMVAIVWLLIRFPSRRGGTRALLIAAVWYVVAKLLETFDRSIWSLGLGVSGHTLKHLASVAATAYLLRFALLRRGLVPESALEHPAG